MKPTEIASFESKTKGEIIVIRGHDTAISEAVYMHASDPGIQRTLGGKDLKRFAPEKFPEWVTKGGGRFMYSAWNGGNLAGLFWVGGESFPVQHFPGSRLQPAYTAAWRTAYSTPEGDTFEGEGIGKRLALAGITDVIKLTRDGGPKILESDKTTTLPPLAQSGLWIDTGIGNVDGQNLYHHLGNTNRIEQPYGFEDIGVYTPPFKEGATPLELEPRIGMIADPATLERFTTAAAAVIEFV